MQRAVARVVVGVGVLWLSVSGPVPASEATPSRRVEITASRYAFSPAEIAVRQGETVELVLRSADTEHGLEVKAYKLKVAIPKGGATVAASFVASRAGRFPLTCSEYCGPGHRRMRGELVVAEAAE